MADWHGYPQDPDAHPERPWWRKSGGTELRVDGLRLFYETDGVWLSHPTWEADRVLVRAHISWGKQSADTIEPPYVEDMMVLADRDFPLPVPEPRCGQVWVAASGVFVAEDTVVTVVRRDGKPFSVTMGTGDMRTDTARWPPFGAVLVAGPGAPWAPPETPPPSDAPA